MGEEKSVEKASIEIEEIEKCTDNNVHEKYQAHPMIWVPTSLLVALLMAVLNIISSFLSGYEFKLRELHSPSTIIWWIIWLLIISYDYKKGNKYAAKIYQTPSYFDWFYEIFYKVEIESIDSSFDKSINHLTDNDNKINSLLQIKVKKTIRWDIILLTAIVWI